MKHVQKKRSNMRNSAKSKSNCNGCPVGRGCNCNSKISNLKKKQNLKFFYNEEPLKNHNYLNYV